MPTPKSTPQLAAEAVTLAQSFSLVLHNHVIYIPTDYETGDDSVTPDPMRTIWVPMSSADIQRKALGQFDTLFQSDKELSNFVFKVEQCCTLNTRKHNSLLIRTKNGLKELKDDGQLYDPSGDFVPNTLIPMLNEDEDDQADVLSIIAGWLNSEEEAVSLLRHIATALAPHWSAVKYVLLLGAGRNGKSVMLSMVQAIFGRENCSSITRQEMSISSPVVLDLNGKLLNLVFDGHAEYVKDSSVEKTLIAGETKHIRRLFASEHTPVQANALFMEGLNHEPRSRDKSAALQARLVRFHFQNTYKLDTIFSERMLSEKYVGALLGLLIKNYVKPADIALMLAPTQASADLALEHAYQNSHALPFIEHINLNDPLGADTMIGWAFDELVQRFNSWRILEGDTRYWPRGDVMEIFRAYIETNRRSERVAGQPRKVTYITGFKSETLVFIAQMKGDEDDATTVVDEGDV